MFPFRSTFLKTPCRCHVLLTRICAESWQGQKPLRRIWRNGTGLGHSWPGPRCNYNEPTIPLWFYPRLKTALEKFAPSFPFGSLHQEGGDWEQSCFEVFWRAGSDWPLCKISTFSVTPFIFFNNKYHIFDKCLTEIFFPEYLDSFSPLPNSFGWFWSKLSKIWPFTFCDFRNP